MKSYLLCVEDSGNHLILGRFETYREAYKELQSNERGCKTSKQDLRFYVEEYQS